MGFVSLDNYEDVLSYHMPTNEQIGAIQEVREAAAQMVETILRVAPACADASAAIRHVREAMMVANAAIVLKGKI
jgi:hypothetical protein